MIGDRIRSLFSRTSKQRRTLLLDICAAAGLNPWGWLLFRKFKNAGSKQIPEKLPVRIIQTTEFQVKT